MAKPPKSRRYCVNCECVTSFKFNPVINHSECTRCGFRFGIKVNDPSTESLIQEFERYKKASSEQYIKKVIKYINLRLCQLHGVTGDQIARIRELKDAKEILCDEHMLDAQIKKMKESGVRETVG